ncbi:Uncharacterised protein [Mycobacteroides abscessus subsp. abscessus]|uniref:hypothetical protein n=1 Tax=Mycobacteroides abscessus TaxID=36809 RepID=UPI00092C7C7A|nr:hypothetical protein [Mycobacteroides abscessus]SIC62604.1 Uncharacterised protein [Mycobacteroides abscessus subsp. abscessus]SIG63337.1 Uncharacterised protein [Mycobacteroides abscessus subsp. abscessus]
MTDALGDLLADIDTLEAEDEEDDYPWHDAWTWTPEPDAPLPPPWIVEDYADDLPVSVSPAPRIAPRDLLNVTLEVVVSDGRAVSWNATEGWDGDTELVAAAKAIAALHSGLSATMAVARGLVAVAVDGHIDPLVWLASGL